MAAAKGGVKMLRRKAAKGGLHDALRAMPSLQRLSDKDIDALVADGVEVTHAEGTVIMKRGDMGVGFHLILSGSVDVVIDDKAVARLGAGEYFGEMGLLDNKPRTADVVVASDLRTLTVLSWAFRPMLERNKGLERMLLEGMSQRLRDLQS